jgi:hypothetical protein
MGEFFSSLNPFIVVLLATCARSPGEIGISIPTSIECHGEEQQYSCAALFWWPFLAALSAAAQVDERHA